MKKKWKPKSTRMEKIIWLHNHFDLWIGWPNNKYSDNRHDSIVEQMKEEGLISHKTYNKDVNITNLLFDVRKLRREKKL